MRKCTGESIREDLHLRSVQGSVTDDLEATQLGQDNEFDVDALISRGYEDSEHAVSVLGASVPRL